jgi:predicted anti-sigma-YlaC factor YlaD
VTSPETYDALSCQELVELVTDYVEGAMPADLSERFDEHIARCKGCTRYLEQMRLTIQLTGRLTPEALTPEAERTLIEAFRSWIR